MIALVTGAGSGIGAAVARDLNSRGYQVAVTDINPDAAAEVGAAIHTFHVKLDVTDPHSIRVAADATEAALGPISLWVCNAGVSTMKRFVDITDEDWDSNFAVNARGVFLCSREAARRLLSRGRPGAIVNVASMAGKQGRVSFLAHYVASKFAVIGLTQAMAFELAPNHIRVNCVCPGFVTTAMQDREIKWEARLRGMTEEDVRALYVRDTPLGRLEEPEDVARAVAFLASEDAQFITGEALAVNGGAFMD